MVPKSTRARLMQFVGLMLLSAVIGATWAAPDAWAQKGGKNPLASKLGEVKKIVRAGQIPGDQAEFFDDFFNKDFLPLFVKPVKPFTLDDLPRLRKELRIILSSNKSGQAHDRVNELTLAKMKEILKAKGLGQYEAAIKYNALLVVGELNEQEAEPGKPAQPYKDAFAILFEPMQSADGKDYLKAAALIGLERYAQVGGIPQPKMADVTKALLEIVNQQEPPAGRDPAAHNFMRRAAAQVLASIGSPGPDNSVLNAFLAVMNDPKTRPLLRCDMAQFIGQLKYPAGTKVDIAQLANTLGHQAIELCKQEMETATTASRPPSKRLIVYTILSTRAGLKGLKAAAAGSPGEKLIDTMDKKLSSIYTELDNPELTDEGVAEKLNGKLPDLSALLGPRERKDRLVAADGKDAAAKPEKK